MSHDDFQTEPLPGLPELPPAGELILWQGKPDWRALATQALNVKWVAGYFGLLAAWRGIAIGLQQGAGLGLKATIPYLGDGPGGDLAPRPCRLGARPDHGLHRDQPPRRDAHRRGADRDAEHPLQLPRRRRRLGRPQRHRHHRAAHHRRDPALLSRLLAACPAVAHRPTQPALRCIPDVAHVAELLADAAETRIVETSLRRIVPGTAIAAE